MSLSEAARKPAIAVLGPTGSGKSELALYLARRFAGEIVNFDSVQMYRGFDVGSAKVSPEQRGGIAHHLIDIADPCQDVTAGDFARWASEALAGVSGRNRLPILTGGTGFYLRALLDGLSPAPQRATEVRQRLIAASERRPAVLPRFLRRFDPVVAGRIHPHDRQKLIRAVEMTMVATRPASVVQAGPRQGLRGYSVLKIGLMPERAALHQRLNQRSEWMFGNGLLDETRALLEAGVPETAKPMLSLGYKQAAAFLEGRIDFDEAVQECQTRTRQYAKRQITWFRSEPDVTWLPGFGSEDQMQREAGVLAANFLARFSSAG